MSKTTPEKGFNLCKTRVPGRYHFYRENPMLAKDASNLQGLTIDVLLQESFALNRCRLYTLTGAYPVLA